MDIREVLRGLNLNQKEIDVYLASLEVGEGRITAISTKVGVPRTSLTYTLEKLRQRRLVEILQKNNRKIYIPLPPRKVISLLKNQRERLGEEIEELERALPQFDSLYSADSGPKIRIFQGTEEIKQIYEEMLEAPIDEIWYIGDTSKIEEILGGNYLKRWVKRRARANIKSKAIRVKTGEIYKSIYASSEELLRTVRFAPEGFESPSHILIYGNTLGIITTKKENVGLLIMSRDLATTMKSLFQEIWNNSKGDRP
ncbi:MAG: hypothetical protein HY434_02545 [Candidatus Liptonbacteria bacterium]|nr:hypothetical protein [Candidatus Liptonbacteria bacterium]